MKDALMLRKGGGENVTPEVEQQVDILDVLDELGLLREAADAVTMRMTGQP